VKYAINFISAQYISYGKENPIFHSLHLIVSCLLRSLANKHNRFSCGSSYYSCFAPS